MRFFGFICALFVAFVAAQAPGQYAINTPTGGFQVTAGQSITITFAPAQGTINIYLTTGSVNTPGQGTLLASNIDGTSGTATFQIPTSIQSSSTGQYNFGVAGANNDAFVNFSAGFSVSGATTTGAASASASSVSASASSRLSSVSASLSSAVSSASSVASSASASASSRASSASSSGSSAASSAASRTSTSSAAAATTSAPSSNGAGMVQAGGMLAMIAGVVAAF